MYDNLWDLIQQCPTAKENGMFPVWDGDSCRWTVETIAGVGVMTCGAVQTCMAGTITGINNTIAIINGSITVIETNQTLLLSQTHTHGNKPLLDSLTNALPISSYLSGNGTYVTLPSVANYYQTVRYSNVDMPQRARLIVGPGLVAEDDPVTGGTIIRSQCPCGGSAEFCASVMACPGIASMQTSVAEAMGLVNNFCGSVASCPLLIDMRNDIDSLITGVASLAALLTSFCGSVASCPLIIDMRNDIDALIASASSDDFVNGGSFNPGTNLLTLTRILGGTVSISLAGLISLDERVKVGPAGVSRFLNVDDFLDTGSDIVVKKQMSITSDAAGLFLVGDQVNPGINMLYGTNAAGTKGWYANTGIEVSTVVSAQTTVVFNYNLNKRANIVCVDASGFEVMPGSKQYLSPNAVTLTFTPSFTGVIYAN